MIKINNVLNVNIKRTTRDDITDATWDATYNATLNATWAATNASTMNATRGALIAILRDEIDNKDNEV